MTSQSAAAAWSQREWPNAGGFLHCTVEVLVAQHEVGVTLLIEFFFLGTAK